MQERWNPRRTFQYEQANNSAGTGMSPVVGNEGGIQGKDKALGSTADDENFELIRRTSKAINVMSQKNY